MTLLLHLNTVDEDAWAQKFRAALPGFPVVQRGDAFAPEDIRYIFVWKPAPDAFEGLDNLKAVLSLGAGVDAAGQQGEVRPDHPDQAAQQRDLDGADRFPVAEVGVDQPDGDEEEHTEREESSLEPHRSASGS